MVSRTCFFCLKSSFDYEIKTKDMEGFNSLGFFCLTGDLLVKPLRYCESITSKNIGNFYFTLFGHLSKVHRMI
jgi:hypothetical protein